MVELGSERVSGTRVLLFSQLRASQQHQDWAVALGLPVFLCVFS